jgi:allophanate hydrolase subunit 2
MLGFGKRLGRGDRLHGPEETADLRHPLFDLPLMRLMFDRPRFDAAPVIDVTDGPDLEEFGASAARLYAGEYLVSPRSNHVGLRLSGDLPRRERIGEVLSRGVPVGAIEVPSTEGLLVLHRGRGVTAGYPVLAVVTAIGLDAIAQVQPGQHLRFRRVSVAEARRRHLERSIRLDELEQRSRELLAVHGIAPAPHGDSHRPSLAA